MSSMVKSMVLRTPLLISTTLKHYFKGAPQPSWDLKFHLYHVFIDSMLSDLTGVTVEELQESSGQSLPVPSGIVVNESKVDNKYRYEAQTHLEKLLKSYEHVLDNEWKDLKEEGIAAEWVQVPNDGWEERDIRKTVLYLHGGAYYMCSKGSHRNITSRFAKEANARVFAIDYRLAPQNQFPAGLQDALAAYLYLLNPPKDAGFEPLNPKNIVISGDSAGGGLSMALGLAIRDSGLPSCAGIIGWSPWLDLSVSMPSMLNPCDDYLPHPAISFRHKESPADIDFKKKNIDLAARIKKQDGPKFWHESFDKLDVRMHFYAPNESLQISYVSPLLAESLGDLPPLLLIAGDEERLRDEIIYFAHKASEPTKYKGPSYNADKFEKSSFKTPTNVTFEIYEEMPHAFQIFEHPCTTISYKRTVEFINRVIDTPNEPLPSSSYNRINFKGELNSLNENHQKVLEWERVGIVPSTNEFKTSKTSVTHKSTPELLVYIVLLFAIISYLV